MTVSWKNTEKNYVVYNDVTKKKILGFTVNISTGAEPVNVSITDKNNEMKFVFCDSKPETIKLIAEALSEVHKTMMELELK